jgi:hypothetical protein
MCQQDLLNHPRAVDTFDYQGLESRLVSFLDRLSEYLRSQQGTSPFVSESEHVFFFSLLLLLLPLTSPCYHSCFCLNPWISCEALERPFGSSCDLGTWLMWLGALEMLELRASRVATSATWDLPRLWRDDAAEASSHLPLRATDEDVVGLWKLFDAFWQDLSCFA